MPIPKRYLADFHQNAVYHVYNRTNNREKLFITEENFVFFLKKYQQYLSKYLDTFSWNLLTNHFHFVVRVKTENAIRASLVAAGEDKRSLTETNYIENRCTLSELIEQAFKRFFQCYAQSFNKWHKRNGNLFYTPFKRILLEHPEDIIRALVYVHRNPFKHGLTKDFTTYPWSSWKNYLNETKNDFICTDVLNLFKNRDDFIRAHEQLLEPEEKPSFWIED